MRHAAGRTQQVKGKILSTQVRRNPHVAKRQIACEAQRLGVADEQQSARTQCIVDMTEDRRLDFSIEVDRNIAAEDGVKTVGVRQRMNEVDALEGDHLTRLGSHFDLPVALILAFKKMARQAHPAEMRHRRAGIDAAFGFGELGLTDVAGIDPHQTCRLITQRFTGAHRDRIRLFAAGASGAEYADRAIVAAAAVVARDPVFPLGEGTLDQVFEVRTLAEEFGLVGGDGILQMRQLLGG